MKQKPGWKIWIGAFFLTLIALVIGWVVITTGRNLDTHLEGESVAKRAVKERLRVHLENQE